MGGRMGESGGGMNRNYLEYCNNCNSQFKVTDQTEREYEVELMYCPFCGIELDIQEEEVEKWEDEEYDELGC